MRLNKYLALCGLGSRRKAEIPVREGRVRINGEKCDDLSRAVGDGDVIEVDGRRVERQDTIYLVLNKPKGYVCAVSDSRDPTVLELLPERLRMYRVFPVGRLDRDSEGLLLLTNDGDFAQRIAHPGGGIDKEYEVLLDRPPSSDSLHAWRVGVTSDGELLRARRVRVMDREPKGRWLCITLSEGKKREIRRMAQVRGYVVQSLLRKRIGKMDIGSLATGAVVEMPVHDLEKMIREGGAINALSEGEEDKWTASMNVHGS